MPKAKHSAAGWEKLPDGIPTRIEVVVWTDTEVVTYKQARHKVRGTLGRVFSTGLVVRDAARTLSLAQSLYLPSGGGHPLQVGDVITIPKSIIRKRIVIAKRMSK